MSRSAVSLALAAIAMAGCSSGDAEGDAQPPVPTVTVTETAAASAVPTPSPDAKTAATYAPNEKRFLSQVRTRGGDLGFQDSNLVATGKDLCVAFAGAPDAAVKELDRAKRMIVATGREEDYPITRAKVDAFVETVFDVLCPSARPEPQETPRPEPVDVTFDTSCNDEWPLTFQTSPFRFVAEVNVHNHSNVDVHVTTTTDWFFFGGGKVSLTKELDLGPGASRRVPFSRPSTVDEISRMVGWQHGDTMCRTTVNATA